MAKKTVKTTKVQSKRLREIHGAIYSLIRSGKPYEEIRTIIMQSYRMPQQAAIKAIVETQELLERDEKRDVTNVIALHNQRYEKIWEMDKNAGASWINDPQEPWEHINNNNIIRRFKTLLKTLKQRERLFGLHTKEFSVAVENNDIELLGISLGSIKRKDSVGTYHEQFDFEKLSLDEKLTILNTIEDSSDIEQYEFSKENTTTHEIFDEDIIQKQINIVSSTQVKIESIPQIAELTEPSNISQETASIRLIDTIRNKIKQNKTAEQVKDTIKESMIEMIEEKYFNKKRK